MSNRNLFLSKLSVYSSLVGMLFLCTGNEFSRLPKEETIKSVTVKNAGFDLMTFGLIDCDNFENLLGKRIKTIELNKEQIKKFKSIYENLKLAEIQEELDVRAKIFISKFGGKIDTVCIDIFGISVNNVNYQRSDELVEFISSLESSFGTSNNVKNRIFKLESAYLVAKDWKPLNTSFFPPLEIQNDFEKIKKVSKDTAILICDMLLLKQHLYNLKTFGQSYGLLNESDGINEITRFSIKNCPGKLRLTKQDIGSGFLIQYKYDQVKCDKNIDIEQLLKEINIVESDLKKSPL